MVLKIFKVDILPPTPRNLTQIKPDVNGVEIKNVHVHPINF